MLHVGGMHMSSALISGRQSKTTGANLEIRIHVLYLSNPHDVVELDDIAMCTM